jgi:hypothetical protein
MRLRLYELRELLDASEEVGRAPPPLLGDLF